MLENFEEYRAHPAVGSHDMMTMLSKSPRHYYLEKFHGINNRKESDAFKFGTNAHSCVMEYPKFRHEAQPEMRFRDQRPKNKKVENGGCKEIWDEYKKEIVELGKKFDDSQFWIDRGDLATLLMMRRQVMKTKSLRILEHDKTQAEFVHVWTDEESGVECKVRFDKVFLERSLFFEYKTTDDASQEKFQKDLIRYHYDLQMYHYMMGLQDLTGEKPKGIWIVQEKGTPYAVNTFVPSADIIENGRHKRRVALHRIAECMESGNWPGYGESINEAALLPWGWFVE